jgi:acetyl-CoA synthetase
MSDETGALQSLLSEDRRIAPPPEFAEAAHVSDPAVYDRADADFEAYWAEWARELDWFEPWEKVLEWDPPQAKWFTGTSTATVETRRRSSGKGSLGTSGS